MTLVHVRGYRRKDGKRVRGHTKDVRTRKWVYFPDMGRGYYAVRK